MSEVLTVSAAAEKYGLAKVTCRAAAATGQVTGATQYGITWVAPASAWQAWRDTARSPGRPRKAQTTPQTNRQI